jgi:hypothetical protein
MSRIMIGLVLVLVAIGTACSSGGGSGSVVETGIAAGFSPDEPNPGSLTVAMAEGAKTGATVTVDVTVTDTGGIYAAEFDISYDPDMATYEGWSPGSLLEQNQHGVFYQVGAPQPGQLVVVATRQGNVSGATANGTLPVIRIAFGITEAGQSSANFQGASLRDASVGSQQIPGISWFSGDLTGN